jgi:hypothetical protein
VESGLPVLQFSDAIRSVGCTRLFCKPLHGKKIRNSMVGNGAHGSIFSIVFLGLFEKLRASQQKDGSA